MTYKPFVWAEGEKANVKEPVEILKEQGWRYGDVPAASNFNWLFKKMTEDVNALNLEVSALRKALTQDITKLTEKSDRLKRCTLVLQSYVNYNLRNNRFNENISWQINEGLKAMERQVQAFHPTYQLVSWPLIYNTTPRHGDELSEIFDEIDQAEAFAEKLEAEKEGGNGLTTPSPA